MTTKRNKKLENNLAMWLVILSTNKQISTTLQETVKELAKMGQNLYENMEGFCRASHIAMCLTI